MGGGCGWGRGKWWWENGDNCPWTTIKIIIKNKLKKIKNRTVLWLSDSTSGNLSKETRNTNLKEHKHPYVHCSIIYNHQGIVAALVSMNIWVDKTT